MIFKSTQPDIDLPTNITTYTWLFSSPSSPLRNHPPSSLSGFTNALTKERLSYSSLKTHTTHLSTALSKNFNLRKGDTVALFSQNTIWYPVALLAVSRIVGIVSGASPAYNIEEMTYALKVSKAKFLFTVEGSMPIAAAAAQNAGIPKERVFLLEGKMEGFTNMAELLEIGRGYGEGGQVEEYRLKEGERNGDLCGFLSFSSGTTGLPKAVMISHQNVIAQCLQITAVLAPSPSLPRKVLALLPAFHITGLVHLLHLPIHLNAEVYMLPSFTMPGMLSVVSEYKIPELLLVPPIIIRLVRDPIVDEYDLSHVTAFSSGAAPLSAEILELLKKKFPNTGFKQGYGMTESCSCLTAHPSDMYSYEYAHKVGTICASTEIKILDEDGKELSYDQPGEIWGKGPQVTMGYLDNEEATRSTYVDGWLRTGDQGMIGRDGMVMITDRIKEMIKVKGIAVAPAELEDLLLGHEFVEDVAVLGIPDEWSGEKPKAFVVRKAGVGGKGGREIGERELGGLLMEYVKERKVRTKWIKEVEFINEIPKSASGKILRRVLRDLHRGKGEGDRGTIVRDEVTEKAKL